MKKFGWRLRLMCRGWFAMKVRGYRVLFLSQTSLVISNSSKTLSRWSLSKYIKPSTDTFHVKTEKLFNTFNATLYPKMTK